MQHISSIRQDIYDHFHKSGCRDYFWQKEFSTRNDAYCVSMSLIQDTAEALLWHRSTGFNANPYLAYIEIWGVLQATFIQQDSINELFLAITNNKNETKLGASWCELREIRNKYAGHPSRKDIPKAKPISRTYLSRGFGGYSNLKLNESQTSRDSTDHPTAVNYSADKREFNLGALIDKYDEEAAAILSKILKFMQETWPVSNRRITIAGNRVDFIHLS